MESAYERRAVQVRTIKGVAENQESESFGGNSGYRWCVLMNVKVVVAILLIAAMPVCAQAQSPSVPRVSKGEAEKVATIIRSDKVKTETYCDLQKLAKQIGASCDENEQILNAYALNPGGAIGFIDQRNVTFRPKEQPTVLVLACVGK